MIRSLLTAATLTLAAAQLAPARAPVAQDSSLVKNERLGFSFRAPKSWSSVALKTDEAWLASKHLSNKEYFGTDKVTGYTYSHVPEMLCITFIHDNLKRTKTVEEESEEGVTTTTTTFSARVASTAPGICSSFAWMEMRSVNSTLKWALCVPMPAWVSQPVPHSPSCFTTAQRVRPREKQVRAASTRWETST